MIRVVLLLLLTVILPGTLISQQVPMVFNHLDRDDGLSSNRVNCILEDSYGFMWFGTEDGLNKFDGYSFEIFRNDPADSTSIIDNTIDFLIEDTATRNILAATPRGLVCLDRSLNRFRPLFKEALARAANQEYAITSLCMIPPRTLLVGTRHGLFRFDLESEEMLGYFAGPERDGMANNPFIINTLWSDRQERVWIGHEEGVEIYDPGNGSFTPFRPEQELGNVYALFEDREQGLWIGTNNRGLFHFPDAETGPGFQFSTLSGHLAGDRVHAIVEQEDGSVLFIVRDGGLYRYDRASGQLSYYDPDIYDPGSINSKAVISMFRSSGGMIWVGTYNSGINCLDNHRKEFEHYRMNFSESGLFNNNIRALFEDSEGYIWVGTKEGGGLSRFDRHTKQFRNFRKSDAPGGLKDDYVFSICELDRHRLLIGTIREGVAIFDKRTERFRHLRNDPTDPSSLADNRVYVTFKDTGGTVWVGSSQHLQIFDPVSERFHTVEGILNPKCMVDGEGQKVWVGSRFTGLYLYDKLDGSLKNYLADEKDPRSLSSNDIYSIERDGGGTLWIGTKRGLCRLDPSTGLFTRYYESSGLPSSWICGLEIDHSGNVWVSTVNGLSRYEVASDRFHNYDVGDGLQGNEFEGFVSLRTSDGHLLFGGRNGFNMFSPERIIDNREAPRIVLTSFKLFNREVPIGTPGSPLSKHIIQTGTLKLRHNQSAVTFGYTALNYTSPEKNEYAYRLHGFDPEWVRAGTSRNAVYTNIPPGKYTFQVIGSNNDGYWNTTGTLLELEILPPFWKTDLAFFVYALTIFLLFMLIRRILIVRIEQRQLIEFERKDKQRIEELNQQKLRFFTNVSHEFRTPLTLIADPLEKLMSYQDENEEKRYLLQIMQNNVRRLLLLINQLIDFRKAEQEKLKLHVSEQDPAAFVKEVLKCFEDSMIRKNIEISVNHGPEEDVACWFDPDVIDKVLFNLLSNAFKYTPKGGRIAVDLKSDGNRMSVSVSDTGKGIPAEELKDIFERFYQVEDGQGGTAAGSGIGLSFSKRLIEAHHGSIEVESIVNVGSRFTIRFPCTADGYDPSEMSRDTGEQGVRQSRLPDATATGLRDSTDAPEEGHRKKKLLIVEDNEELSQYLASSFRSYTVFTADNGLSGLKTAVREIPDVIISDVMMPEMDGIEMCRQIKTHLATSHIPVVLLSARTEVVHKIEGIETGADAYIEKPFDQKYLESVVRNLLKQRAALRRKYSEEPGAEMKDLGLTSHELKFIEKTLKIIERNIDSPDFSVESLGMEIGLSRSQLFRKFRSVFDLKPSELIRSERLKKARELLSTREFNINEVAYQTGFKSSSYFITTFRQQYGETPNEYLGRIKNDSAVRD